MTLEESLDFIRTEFLKELDKRKDALEKIAELQEYKEQLKRDLKAYRSIYPMKNEVCGKCALADECPDANRVEGEKLCSSFHAKLESEE